MKLLALGLNHKTAPVDVRERLAFGPDIIAGALRDVTAHGRVQEAVILSTCNRTELYGATDNGGEAQARDWIAHFHGLDAGRVAPYLYAHAGRDAVCHLLRVSCGLDSMVLGEPQILGQVKGAFETARDCRATGKVLNRLFQHTFSVAKTVRTDTAIGGSPVSVAFAAVGLARQIFSDLSKRTALLIGAGETVELAARHLHNNGIGRIVVANRTVERAHELAAQFDGFAIGLTEMANHLSETDIVISSTASPLPVLGKGTVERALKKRKHRPMFMVDIAVPRDIEPEVADLSDVYLYTIDDIQGVVDEGLRSRKAAAVQAEEIVAFHAEEFMAWLRSCGGASMIHDYRQNAERMRDEVMARARRQLNAGKPPDEVLSFLAHTLTNKLLHAPSTRLRQAAREGDAEFLQAANELLQIGRTGS